MRALGFEADGEAVAVLMRRFDADHDRTLDVYEFAALASHVSARVQRFAAVADDAVAWAAG